MRKIEHAQRLPHHLINNVVVAAVEAGSVEAGKTFIFGSGKVRSRYVAEETDSTVFPSFFFCKLSGCIVDMIPPCEVIVLSLIHISLVTGNTYTPNPFGGQVEADKNRS